MIYAYTASNLGDDLFILHVCKRYPHVQFFLYGPRYYKQTFAHVHNLRVISNNSLLRKGLHWVSRLFKRDYFIREYYARKCDVGIYVGGSIFMEHENWQQDVRNVQSIVNSHPHRFIIGANFGPFQSDDFKKTYESLFRSVTDICFRDRKSYTIFSHLRNVRLAPDILFQIPVKKSETKERRIVISVIHPGERDDLKKYSTVYFKQMAHITTRLLHAGEKVTFVSFCVTEKDDIAIKSVKAFIPDVLQHAIETYHYWTNMDDVLQIIAEAKGIIATRFHAMILGWVYRKPVFPIVYSDKMVNVIQDTLFPGKYVELSQMEELTMDVVYEALQMGTFHNNAVIDAAAGHFKILDQHLME